MSLYATASRESIIGEATTQTGIMMEHWKEASDIMLQKKVAVNNIEKLRCTCLLEGDKNFALKHVARTAMREYEKNEGGFSEMQYGYRKRKTTYQATLAVVSIMDLAALARTNIATVDTDCKSPFNCCIPELIWIKMLATGVPEKPVKFLYNHLTQVAFDVLAGCFKSKKRYGVKTLYASRLYRVIIPRL